MSGWLSIVGKDDDDDDREKRERHDREHEGRGEYGRDRDRPWYPTPPWWQQQQPQWQQPWPQYQPSYYQPWQRQWLHREGRPVAQVPGGFRWARGYGGVPGHWERQRAWVVGAEPGVGPGPIPPRNALVEAPGPDHAGREVLPMSTGVAILPTQSAQITARPQRVAFRPERVFISAAGTSGGAADWVVNDIKIGNRSQFSQSGDVPGDMFATNAIDGFVSFETAQTAMDVVMVVTYIGLNESGVPFFASIVGTAAI
jgi:hypothetical protein